MNVLLGTIDGVLGAVAFCAGIFSYFWRGDFEHAVIFLLVAAYFSIYAVRFAIMADDEATR